MKLKLLLLAVLAAIASTLMVVGSAEADSSTSSSTSSTTAAAADYDCSDFSNQAAAQAVYLAAGGPASDPYRLDADHNGIACETLPCPCSYTTTTPPTSTPTTAPTTAPAAVSSVVKLKASPERGKSGASVRLKITRLVDTGSGLVPTTGRVSLQEHAHGRWRPIQGSSTLAKGGHATLRYYIYASFKIRAKGRGPTAYSKPISLHFR